MAARPRRAARRLRFASLAAALLLALPAGAEDAAPKEPTPDGATAPAKDPDGAGAAPYELWAGHQVVLGRQEVPVLGEIVTRTDTYFLAKVWRREAGVLEFLPVSCRIDVKEATGVKVRFDPETPPKLPPAMMTLVPGGEDTYYALPWVSGWGEEDVDGDGHPGVTIDVEAPVCSGRLYVASRSRQRARARRQGDEIVGRIKVRVEQRMLGADGVCLKMIATDSVQDMEGTFAWRRVDPGASCASLSKGAWPVKAPAPTAATGQDRRRKRR